MTTWSAAAVACAILSGDNNIHENRERTAQIEAEAFLAAATPRVSLETLLSVAYAESRFGTTGSQRDRDSGWWGVMQIAEHTLNCWGRPERVTWRSGRRHRLHVRYVRHDDPSFCTPEQTAARARMLDPAWNIAHGARMLNTAWERVHGGHYRRQTIIAWVGAYYWGSVPRRRRDMRGYLRYAGRVQHGDGIMRRRLQQCRER